MVVIAVCAGLAITTHREALADQNFPSSEQIFSSLSVCALNANLTVDANIAGSLRSLFSDAATEGRFSVNTTTSFLQLFPDSDKLKAYRAYRYCLFSTLHISPDSICGKPQPSRLTRAALGRFTVSGSVLANREDILSALLEALLRKSRKYQVVVSENDFQAMEKLSDADQLTSLAMANDIVECDSRAEEAFLPSAAALGDSIVINVRIVDVSSSKVLRVVQEQGQMSSPQELDALMMRTWRDIEQGLAPESWIWRNGVGYCNKLKSLLANATAATCASDETFQLMEDKKTSNDFIDSCQSTWRRNQMEPVCLFTCNAGKITDLRLYKRLDATSLTNDPRSASEQGAFIDKLKTRFGFTDQELTNLNIKPIYPGVDLTDPDTIFTSTARDINACLTTWSVGGVTSGDSEGGHSDEGSKTITFSSGTRKLILELERWSDGATRWNFVSAYSR